jgi:hypothetical protein
MPENKPSSLWRLTALGTLFQLAMVLGGHYSEFIRNHLFAAVGMAISLVFGAMFGRSAATTRKEAALGGAMVGGLCALLGIAVSVALGDTLPAVLGFGTAGSAVAGLLGGLAGRALAGKGQRAGV